MSTTIGFPRLGEFREFTLTTENLDMKSQQKSLVAAKELRAKHWNIVENFRDSVKYPFSLIMTMLMRLFSLT